MITLSPRTIKIIRLSGILYLTLPILVLYTSCFSLPFVLLFDSLFVVMLFFCWKTIFEEQEVSVPAGSLVSLACFVVILLLISGVGAFTGYQNGDPARSNAIMSDLVYNDWPVTYNDGGCVSVQNYYYAAFLIPALVGKAFMSFRVAEVVLFFWIALGMVLMGLFLLIVLNNRRWYVFLLLAGFSGLDVIGVIINQPGMFDGAVHLDHWAKYANKSYGNFIANYQSFGTAVNWSIHHYVTSMIVAFYFVAMVKHHNYKLTALLASAQILWTPLTVFGLIPLVFIMLAVEKFDLRKFISKADIISLGIIAVPVVMYFLAINIQGTSVSTSTKGTSGGLFYIRGLDWLEHNWPIMFLFSFLEFGLLWILVWNSSKEKFTRTDRAVLITVLSVLFGYLFIDYTSAHDFSMRATIIPWMVLFAYYADSFMFADSRHRNYLVIYAVIAFLSCSTEYSRDIGETVKNNFHPRRAYWQDNTIDEHPLQYIFVGNINAPFYRIFLSRKPDVPTADEICSEKNLLASGSGSNVYFYNDYLVFNGISPDDKRFISIKYHYADGRVFSKDYKMSQIRYRFGSLWDSGLGGVRLHDYLFSSLQVIINGDNYTISSADIMKHMSTVTPRSYVRFSQLTNKDWNKGINRNGSIILIDRPSLADRQLVGKTLEYNKKLYKVTDVRYKWGFTHVYINKPIHDVDESSNIALIK